MDTIRSICKHAAAAAAAVLVAACGGGGAETPAASAQGTLRLALTDAPACGFDAVHVTVDRVRVHASAAAGSAEAGWTDIALAAPRRIDLLSLTNGVLEELGQAQLPAGRYQQLRLVLVPNTAANPMANAVTPSGGAEVALETPSAVQSGLKMNVDVEVAAGQLADLVIDFDACKSVVPRGRSGRFNLKPVLRVMTRLSDAGARIVGHVDAALAGATVSAQQNGSTVVSTVPEASTGRFVLTPLPEGSYTLVVAGAGRATGVVTGVPVTLAAPTVVAAAGSPIALPDGAPRGTTVTLNATPDPESALLRSTQVLTGGASVEVQAVPVPSDGTPVTLTLPSAAPQVAAYAASAATPAFQPDASATVVGRYTVHAVAVQPAPAAPLVKTAPLDISASVPDPLPALAFVFP